MKHVGRQAADPVTTRREIEKEESFTSIQLEGQVDTPETQASRALAP